MRSTNHDAIDFNTLYNAAAAGDDAAVFNLIYKVECEQPELLTQLLSDIKQAIFAQEQIEKASQRSSQSGMDHLEENLRDAEIRATSLLSDIHRNYEGASSSYLSEKIILNRIKMELLAAMYRYALKGGDDAKLVSSFVTELRAPGSGSAEDVRLLDSLGKDLSYLRHGSNVVIKTVAPSLHAQKEEKAKSERDEVLRKLQTFDEDLLNDDQTLKAGIEKLLGIQEFILSITQIGVDQKQIPEYIQHLFKIFDDSKFDDHLKLGLHSNKSLIDVAIRLEDCVTCITMIYDGLIASQNLFGHDKLIQIRQLQELNHRIDVARQRLANEMFQRMLYIDAKTIAKLADKSPSLPISCPSKYLNFLKFKNNKADRIQPVGMARLRLFTEDPQAMQGHEGKSSDNLLPAQVAKYMLYIARRGSKQQKQYLDYIMGKEALMLREVVADAKAKMIVEDESDVLSFCAQFTYFGDTNFKTFKKIVSLCRNKVDYDKFILAFSNIGDKDLRNSICRLINSDDICESFADATRLTEMMLTIDRISGLRVLILDLMKKFQPISDDELWQLVKALAQPEKFYGHRLISMFFTNCMEGQESLRDYMRTTDDCSRLLKQHPFLFVLYNYLDKDRVANIFENVFEKDTRRESLAAQISNQVFPDYERGMAVAAGPLNRVIGNLPDKDACIEELLNYVILVNDITNAAASAGEEEMDQTLHAYVLFSHRASELHQYGLRDAAVNILQDKLNQKGNEIFTSQNPVIQMRNILMQALLFIAKADHLKIDESGRLVDAAIRLFRELKSSNIGEKEKLSLFSAAAAIVGEAGNSPVNRQKVEKYMKLILALKGAKPVAEELKSFNAVLSTCLPSAEARPADAPSVLHARNPAISPRGVRRSPEAAPAAPNPRDNRKK